MTTVSERAAALAQQSVSAESLVAVAETYVGAVRRISGRGVNTWTQTDGTVITVSTKGDITITFGKGEDAKQS